MLELGYQKANVFDMIKLKETEIKLLLSNIIILILLGVYVFCVKQLPEKITEKANFGYYISFILTVMSFFFLYLTLSVQKKENYRYRFDVNFLRRIHALNNITKIDSDVLRSLFTKIIEYCEPYLFGVVYEYEVAKFYISNYSRII